MMKKLFFPLLFLAVLMPRAAFGADKAADVVYVSGAVQIERNQQSMNAVLQMPVMQGDTITTQANSRAKLLFTDDSVITIGPASRFSVSEYLYNIPKQRSQSLFGLLYGRLRAVVGRTALKITTATATAGVRGTVFEVWVDSATQKTYVAVLEGSVELRNIRPEIKGSRIVTAGNMSSVASGEPPKPPAPFTSLPGALQPGAAGQGEDMLPGPELPPPGPGPQIKGQALTNMPVIHQMPRGFSRVGINVVFP
jgi:FecR-like protein